MNFEIGIMWGDTLGHLLALRVMPANEQDRTQVRLRLDR